MSESISTQFVMRVEHQVTRSLVPRLRTTNAAILPRAPPARRFSW